ncbi:hypothetical protein BDF20DRAFT_861956 [Mycotypha africana]|uniref:uncharacterized protein n=1 Tax=Mycotypha africana TaxID=64632 RepID=UPI002300EC3C|nr:uncharacterized protein BDF20DRAFT_861956 [Mycotypha africana]KAI8981596.1 hypothetical protein BDF20DRAFT_861956 [Mycotypha africana]
MPDTAVSSNRSSIMMDPSEDFTGQFMLENQDAINTHIQRHRWELFFRPEYTFESYMHGSTKPLANTARHQRNMDCLVNGARLSSLPPSQQNLESKMNAPRSRPSPYNLSSRPSFDGTASFSTASSSLPTTEAGIPTLPNLAVNSAFLNSSSGNCSSSTMTSSECDKAFVRERLELLKKVRMQGKDNDNRKRNSLTASDEERPCILADEMNNRRQSFIFDTTARWKQQFTIAAKQIRSEVGKGDDSISAISDKGTINKLEKSEQQLTEMRGADEKMLHSKSNSCLSIYCRRPSLICFILGFFCPLFWLFGAIHFSSCANRQNAANRRMDHVWRRRSRTAFILTMIGLMVALIVIFVLKPETVGYRQSRSQNDTD